MPPTLDTALPDFRITYNSEFPENTMQEFEVSFHGFTEALQTHNQAPHPVFP